MRRLGEVAITAVGLLALASALEWLLIRVSATRMAPLLEKALVLPEVSYALARRLAPPSSSLPE